MKKIFLFLSLTFYANIFLGNIYYSLDDGNFSDTTIWNTATDGSGIYPSDSELTEGSHSFYILNSHDIVLDQDINALHLEVGGGSNGSLTIGNADSALTITTETLTVNAGAKITIGDFTASHEIELSGDLINNGTINLKKSSGKLANLICNSTLTIQGANSPILNNLTINSGTTTANVSLDIEGSMTIESGCTFADGDLTHTIAGNWIENGNGQMTGNGTIIMDATLLQALNTRATFNNLIINGGGIVTLSDQATVTGNFSITNNSTVSTASNQFFYGNFTVEDGSTYTATGGGTYFQGTDDQTIDIGTNVTFRSVVFRYATAGQKSITGVLDISSGGITISSTENVTLESNGYSHSIQGNFRQEGILSTNDTIILKGGTVFNNNGDLSLDLGDATIDIQGNVYIQAGDTLYVNEKFTITSGYLVINDGSFLIQNNSGKTFSLADASSLYIRGFNNFPTGFDTYDLASTSFVRYDADIVQFVRGNLTYGHLLVSQNQKLIEPSSSGITVEGWLYLRNSVQFYMNTYDNILKYGIDNDSDATFISAGSVTIDLDDLDNSHIETAGSGSYTFKDLTISMNNLSDDYNFDIEDNITVNGNFTINKLSGNAANTFIVNISDYTIINDGEDTLNIGAECRLQTSGDTGFATSISSFAETILDDESIIRFTGTDQEIPVASYGSIEIQGIGTKTLQGDIFVANDISRTNNTPVLTDAGYEIEIQGDWSLDRDYTDMTGTTIFSGSSQEISESYFNDVIISGSDTKTVTGLWDMSGDLTINDGTTLDFSTYALYIEGNFINTGTGIFSQSTGTTTFDASSGDQTITTNSSGAFGSITISLTDPASQSLIANSDIYITRDVRFTQDQGNLNLNGQTLYIGRNWIIYTGCTFTHADGTLHFNGSDEDQDLYNYDASYEYGNMTFSGASIKRLNTADFDINGDVYIDGATLNSNGRNMYVDGDWTNTGTFTSGQTVTFDGADQTIGNSTFNHVVFAGSDTKTLDGNITCTGNLTVNSGSTLDVSANNYSITIEQYWDNDGTFIPQTGTVTFIGGGSRINNGGNFYNLVCNENSGYTLENEYDINIDGDLTIDEGIFRMDNGSDMTLAGSLINNSTLSLDNGEDITFDGTSGTHTIQTNGSTLRQITFDASGAVYQLADDMTIGAYNYRFVTINDGTLDLNGYSLSNLSNYGGIQINGGTFMLSPGGETVLGRQASINNDGGILKIVGDQTNFAKISSNQTNTGRYISINQTAGTLHAKYYTIERTMGSGLHIEGGTIDSENNLSYGRFTSCVDTNITFNGIDLSNLTAEGVFFDAGVTNNVSAVNCTLPNTITFEYYSGTRGGDSYENDPDDIVNWNIDAHFWTGAIDDDWHTAGNWADGIIPTDTTNVFIDAAFISGSSTVTISKDTAFSNRVIIGSGTSVVLNGNILKINDLLEINGGTLTQTNAEDTIMCAGSWMNNGGTYNENDAVVLFNGTGGEEQIRTQNNDPFNTIIIDAPNTTYTLSGNIDINGDLTLEEGSLDVSSNNRTISLAGNYTCDAGELVYRTGTFNLDGTDQEINGGIFYNLVTKTSGTKTLSSNAEVNGKMTINSGTVFNGSTYILYIKGNFDNYEGYDGFVQTGAGTVIFNGTNQNICQNGSNSTFNNIFFENSGAKRIYQSINVDGNISLNFNNWLYLYDLVDGTGTANTLTVNTGNIYVTDEFPQNFENINLNTGYVRYAGNIDQDIYPTSYYHLQVYTNGGTTSTTKTLTGDIEIDGNLYIYEDTQLDVDDYTITLYGSFTIEANTPQVDWGTVGGTGTLIHEGGNITFNSNITLFNNLILRGTYGSDKVIATDITVTGDLTIDEGVDFFMYNSNNVDNYRKVSGTTGKSFTLLSDSRLFVSIPASEGIDCFPDGFSNYSCSEQASVYIRGNDDVSVAGGFEYGILYIQNTGNATLSDELTVNGDFYMNNSPTLVDNNFDLTFNGDIVDIRDYPSPTSTIYFSGNDQSLRDGEGNYYTFEINNVVFAGTGTKTISNDYTDIDGTVEIQEDITFTTNRDVFFAGSSWINDEGIFEQTGEMFYFDGTTPQSVDAGENNLYNGMTFDNTDAVTFINNSFNVNTGNFAINTGATVNTGSLTHYIASANVTNEGTWNATNTDLVFNRNNTQNICTLDINDITLTNAGNKYCNGDWTVNNMIVDDADVDLRTNDYTITCKGNWDMNGDFVSGTSLVAFESTDSYSKTIFNNGDVFYDVTFNQSSTNSREYSLLGDTKITNELTIGNGATLTTNSYQLSLGNNDTDNPAGEQHLIENGGTLYVDASGVLNFDGNDNNTVLPKLTVEGTLKLLGDSDNNAIVERTGTQSRYEIEISTGTISANYYEIADISDDGFIVSSSATVDATNNFSNGRWSGMNTNSSATRLYLQLDAPVTNNIENINFEFNGTPTVGSHFNVKRTVTTSITFDGDISGILGGSTYEDDGGTGAEVDPGVIIWPPISSVTWTGAVSSDWFNAGNWSPAQVPDENTDANIPLVTNNPIIFQEGAECRDLTLSDGILIIESGYDISIHQDITIGTSSNTAIVLVEDGATDIEVKGSWYRGSQGSFIHGNCTVEFTASSGNITIQPRTSPFYNILFSGNATYTIDGTNLDFEGDFTISNGIITQDDNNYIFNLYGNFENNGTYLTSTTGTVYLLGNNQSITEGSFYNLVVDGSGTKTFYDETNIVNTVTVNSTMTATLSCNFDIGGNMTINTGATFNDGDQTHTFSGTNWYGYGDYVGDGKIDFTGTGNQYIYSSNFANLDFTGTGRIYLQGDVDVTGDINIYNTINQFFCYDYLINNTSETGTFFLEDNEYIRVTGADNFPDGFSTYTLEESSWAYYSGTDDQTIKGISYGHLLLSSSEITATLDDNTIVKGNIYFRNTSLDVSTNNYNLTVYGDWDNNEDGDFICREGEVIFMMEAASNQDLWRDPTETETFYDLTINRPDDGYDVRISTAADIVVENDFTVTSGDFYANGKTIYVGGNLIVVDGNIETTGTFYLNKPSGSATIQTNGSTLNNLTINTTGTTNYSLSDSLIINGNLDLTNATLNLNGNNAQLGTNIADVITISGTFISGAGSTIEIGDGINVVVNQGGVLQLVGTSDDPVTMTRRYSNRFSITVDGTIQAEYYQINYLNTAGVYITADGTIDETYNLSNGVFSYGYSGGTYLKIENDQDFQDPNHIENVVFMTNPGGGASNVTKSTATAGTVEFYNAQGSFAGESYDNDPNDLIDWTGPVTLIWKGYVDSDWNEVGNWETHLGTPATDIPSLNEDVIIEADHIQQPVITDIDAKAKSIEIESGAFLTVISTATGNIDLETAGNIDIEGALILSSEYDSIYIGGNWEKPSGATFNPGTSYVTFGSTSGVKYINNVNSQFYNLIISEGDFDLSDDTEVLNDFTISSGASFDLSSANNTLTVGGNFINEGEFIAQEGELELNASSGTKIFNPGTSTLAYLNINPDAGVTYTLTANPLVATATSQIQNGTLDLNGLDFTFGDGSGSDALSISGTLDVQGNNTVYFGNDATINVTGTLSIIGNSKDDPATVTSLSGTYNLNILSGGTIAAKYYLFEYMSANGIILYSGSSVDATYNLSHGTFANGATGGKYLNLKCSFSSDLQIDTVTFKSGPTTNVKRTTGTNNVIFYDADGVFAGYRYEDDDEAASATEGKIRWSYTHLIADWTGNTNTDWDEITNWTLSSGTGIPEQSTIVNIPDVSETTGNFPVISSDAEALDVNIWEDASLTINNNADLTIEGNISIEGTLTIESSSNTTISVEGSWNILEDAVFEHNNTGTVVFTNAAGTEEIDTYDDDNDINYSFNNLYITGAGTYELKSDLEIEGDFILQNGTLETSNNVETISCAGNWTNTGTFTNTSLADVVFNGTYDQDIEDNSGGLYNIILEGCSSKYLVSDLYVGNNLTIESCAVLDQDSYSITLKGNWVNNNGGSFVKGSDSNSDIILTGTKIQYIYPSSTGDYFHNFTVNNTKSGSTYQIRLYGKVYIDNNLELTDGIILTTFSNYIHFQTNATVNDGTAANAGNDDSYIDGWAVKEGISDFTFPVGDAGIRARIGISGIDASQSGTFKTQFTASGYSDLTSFNSGLTTGVADNGYWDLRRTSGDAEPYVSIYWDEAWYSIDDEAYVRVGHYDSGKWYNMGSTETNDDEACTSSSKFTSFSPVAPLEDAWALPIELESFSGYASDDKVYLNWTTASETNNDFFTVERSDDAINYSSIGTVKGAGNSTVALDYSFTDNNPANGINYYRLKQTDFDGAFSYSDIIAISFDNMIINTNSLEVYPTIVEAGETLNILYTGLSEGNIEIFNTNGVKIHSLETSGDNTQELISLSINLPLGVYYVKASGNDDVVLTSYFIVK